MTVQPLFASSVFSISSTCEVYQVLTYDYFDPDGVYKNILKKEQAFEREIQTLWTNMTKILEAEKVYINDRRVDQKILHVDIGLRGSRDLPYFQWVIYFSGPPKHKVNTLRSEVDEEVAEYDIEVLYLFPAGTKIVKIITPMEYDMQGSLLLVWARKGDHVGGYEEVQFEFSSPTK